MSEGSLLDSVKPVPSAEVGGAQKGRESPKQRKQKMLASIRNKSGKEIPKEVLDFEKANGLSVPDVQKPEPSVQQTPEPKKQRRQKQAKPERKKIVISMKIDGVGVYRTPAYNVIDAGYGLFVVLPVGNDDTIFIPGVGTQVTISNMSYGGGGTWKCFYPGIVAEIPGLDACVLAFVKADESGKESS